MFRTRTERPQGRVLSVPLDFVVICAVEGDGVLRARHAVLIAQLRLPLLGMQHNKGEDWSPRVGLVSLIVNNFSFGCDTCTTCSIYSCTYHSLLLY